MSKLKAVSKGQSVPVDNKRLERLKDHLKDDIELMSGLIRKPTAITEEEKKQVAEGLLEIDNMYWEWDYSKFTEHRYDDFHVNVEIALDRFADSNRMSQLTYTTHVAKYAYRVAKASESYSYLMHVIQILGILENWASLAAKGDEGEDTIKKLENWSKKRTSGIESYENWKKKDEQNNYFYSWRDWGRYMYGPPDESEKTEATTKKEEKNVDLVDLPEQNFFEWQTIGMLEFCFRVIDSKLQKAHDNVASFVSMMNDPLLESKDAEASKRLRRSQAALDAAEKDLEKKEEEEEVLSKGKKEIKAERVLKTKEIDKLEDDISKQQDELMSLGRLRSWYREVKYINGRILGMKQKVDEVNSEISRFTSKLSTNKEPEQVKLLLEQTKAIGVQAFQLSGDVTQARSLNEQVVEYCFDYWHSAAPSQSTEKKVIRWIWQSWTMLTEMDFVRRVGPYLLDRLKSFYREHAPSKKRLQVEEEIETDSFGRPRLYTADLTTEEDNEFTKPADVHVANAITEKMFNEYNSSKKIVDEIISSVDVVSSTLDSFAPSYNDNEKIKSFRVYLYQYSAFIRNAMNNLEEFASKMLVSTEAENLRKKAQIRSRKNKNDTALKDDLQRLTEAAALTDFKWITKGDVSYNEARITGNIRNFHDSIANASTFSKLHGAEQLVAVIAEKVKKDRLAKTPSSMKEIVQLIEGEDLIPDFDSALSRVKAEGVSTEFSKDEKVPELEPSAFVKKEYTEATSSATRYRDSRELLRSDDPRQWFFEDELKDKKNRAYLLDLFIDLLRIYMNLNTDLEQTRLVREKVDAVNPSAKGRAEAIRRRLNRLETQRLDYMQSFLGIKDGLETIKAILKDIRNTEKRSDFTFDQIIPETYRTRIEQLKELANAYSIDSESYNQRIIDKLDKNGNYKKNVSIYDDAEDDYNNGIVVLPDELDEEKGYKPFVGKGRWETYPVIDLSSLYPAARIVLYYDNASQLEEIKLNQKTLVYKPATRSRSFYETDISTDSHNKTEATESDDEEEKDEQEEESIKEEGRHVIIDTDSDEEGEDEVKEEVKVEYRPLTSRNQYVFDMKNGWKWLADITNDTSENERTKKLKIRLVNLTLQAWRYKYLAEGSRKGWYSDESLETLLNDDDAYKALSPEQKAAELEQFKKFLRQLKSQVKLRESELNFKQPVKGKAPERQTENEETTTKKRTLSSSSSSSGSSSSISHKPAKKQRVVTINLASDESS